MRWKAQQARIDAINRGEWQSMEEGEVPPLSTVNGFGFGLRGREHYDPATDTYETCHYLLIAWLPVMPWAGRYRVRKLGDGRFLFLAETSPRKSDWLRPLTVWLIAGVVAWMLWAL